MRDTGFIGEFVVGITAETAAKQRDGERDVVYSAVLVGIRCCRSRSRCSCCRCCWSEGKPRVPASGPRELVARSRSERRDVRRRDRQPRVSPPTLTFPHRSVRRRSTVAQPSRIPLMSAASVRSSRRFARDFCAFGIDNINNEINQ